MDFTWFTATQLCSRAIPALTSNPEGLQTRTQSTTACSLRGCPSSRFSLPQQPNPFPTQMSTRPRKGKPANLLTMSPQRHQMRTGGRVPSVPLPLHKPTSPTCETKLGTCPTSTTTQTSFETGKFGEVLPNKKSLTVHRPQQPVSGQLCPTCLLLGRVRVPGPQAGRAPTSTCSLSPLHANAGLLGISIWF